MIKDPSGSWCIKETDESMTRMGIDFVNAQVTSGGKVPK